MANMNNKKSHPVAVNYLSHPLTSEGAKSATVESGITISQALKNVNYPVQEFDELMVWVNGKPVEGYESYYVYPGDVVNVRPVVKGKNAGAIIAAVATIVISIYFPPAGAAMGMGQLATAVVTAGLIYGATMLIYSAFPPPEPQEIARKESYLLASTRNRSRLFEALPLVIGKIRMAPDVASSIFGRFENNKQTVNQIYHFGLQTSLKLEDWRIGDTPIGDFSTPPVITMPDSSGNLPDNFNDIEVIQGSEVKKADGPLVVTTSPGSIGVAIDVQAIAYDVDGDGDVKDRSIDFTFSVYDVPTNSLVHSEDLRIVGSKINEARATYESKVLPKGQYRVEVTKNSFDKNASDGQRNLTVVAIKSIQEDNTDYTNQLRVGLTVEAQNRLTGTLDQLTALAYDSIPVFDGSSWDIKPTDNPAWWFLWFARGKRDGQGKLLYGGGLSDSQIDIQSVIKFAAWCDRKKLTCGMLLNKNSTVKKVLNTIARCGRGEYTWGSGKLGVIWDDDQAVPVAVFGPSNIRTDTFTINYDATKTADEVIVNFLNKENDYKPDSVRVTVGNTASPERPTQIQFEGCLDPDMAGREANLIAAAQLEMRRTISWETDIEGVVVKRGDVVRLSHDIVGWSQSGRVVMGNDRQSFFIDKDITFTNKGMIGIRTPSGKYQAFKVQGVNDRLVTISTQPSASFEMPGETNSPAEDWLWFYDEGGKPGRLVKITDVQVKNKNTLSFTAKDYSQDYYAAENGAYVHKPTISTPKPVGNLIPGVFAWETYRIDGEKRTQVLALSWSSLSLVNQYTVKIWNEKAGGEQTAVTETSGARFDVVPGIYNYRISGTDSITSQTYSAVGRITITGSATINPLTEVRAEGVLGGVIVSWKYPPNAVNLRKIDIVARWNAIDGSQSYIETFSEPYPINTLTHSGLDVAQRVDYELTLVDAEGNKSTPVNVFGITSDNIDQIIGAIDGQLGESALDQSLKNQIDKIDQNELLLTGYIGSNDAALEKIRNDLSTAKNEASQGIADANKEINNVNSTLTGAVNNANSEIDKVKQDLVNAVAQEQENNAQLKKELESLIAVAGVATYSQPDEPASGKEGDIWFKEDAEGNVVDVYRFHNGVWELSSHADIEANAAAIINEQTVRASADEALGHRIDALVVKTGSNEAAITAESTARASADSAIAQLVNEVKATSESNSAAIKSEETARTDADTALASKIDALTTTVGKNTADITTEQTVRANADTALSQRIDRVSSKSDQNEAAISAESTTRASADGALSMRIDSVTAKAGANESAIQSEITARTDADSALSSRIDSVTAKAAQNESAIAAESTARADADKAFASQVSNISASVASIKDDASTNSANIIVDGQFTGSAISTFKPDATGVDANSISPTTAKTCGELRGRDFFSDKPIQVSSGQKFYFSLDAVASQAATQKITFGMAFADRSGNTIKWLDIITFNPNSTRSWVSKNAQGSAPEGAVEARIYIIYQHFEGQAAPWYVTNATIIDMQSADILDKKVSAQISTINDTIASTEQALSRRIDSVSANVDNKASQSDVSALSNRLSQAEVDINGKASASEVATISASIDSLKDNAITNSANIIVDGQFSGSQLATLKPDATGVNASSISPTTAKTCGELRGRDFFTKKPIQVSAGQKFYFSLDAVASSGATAEIVFGMAFIDKSGNTIKWMNVINFKAESTRSWTSKNAQGVAPSGAVAANIYIIYQHFEGQAAPWYVTNATIIDMQSADILDKKVSAQISTVNQAIVDTEKSLTQQVTQLESEFDGKTAAIQQELTTTVNKVGEVESKYSVKVDNNGYVSGFGLISTENNGTPTSEFAVRADKFFIAAPAGSNYDGGDNKYPFIVQNGKVYMRNAVIQNGAIDSAKIANVIQSTNYVPGKAGWKLPKNGAAEFNSDVVVNAKIQANSIVGDIVTAKSKQGTTATQNISERDTPLFASISISEARPFDRTLVIRVGLRVAAKSAEGSSDLHPCSGMIKCTSTQYGQRVSFVQSVYSFRGIHNYYNTLDSIAEVIYDIPANTKGTIYIYGRKLLRQGGLGGESYVRVFPVDGNPESPSATGKFIAQLFKNGSDLV